MPLTALNLALFARQFICMTGMMSFEELWSLFFSLDLPSANYGRCTKQSSTILNSSAKRTHSFLKPT